jgi:DNA replication ATP-dependent helicase Dna2
VRRCFLLGRTSEDSLFGYPQHFLPLKGMRNEAIATLFYRELEKIHQHDEWTAYQQVEGLYQLFNRLFLEVTQAERVQFTTLFARMSFACHQYGVDRRLQFYLHKFRKLSQEALHQHDASPEFLAFGKKVLARGIAAFYDFAVPEHIQQFLPAEWPIAYALPKVTGFKPYARVLVLADDGDAAILTAKAEEQPSETIKVQYNIAERNDQFTSSIQLIRHVFGFPVMLNLIDVEIDEHGTYRPAAFVIEPDYLVDVTAVAECFKGFGTEPLSYLLKKFLPFTSSIHLMIGNIANFFLDELMTDDSVTFKETFPKVFALNPLAFCLFDNREVRDIMQRSQLHFVHLKRIVKDDFRKSEIDPDKCFLEPSFYSNVFGVQGRLDVFCANGGRSAIVELKSGKPFRPNKYGLSQNHYVQTLMYALLVQSVFDKKLHVANYILYSGVDERQLRFAPSIKSQQYEALNLRNQLLALEHMLATLGQDPEKPLLAQGRALFGKLATARWPNAKGFFIRDVQQFEQHFKGLTEVEQLYFIAFSGFIAREHRLAKTGVQGIDAVNGVASLWLDTFEQKIERFELLNHLVVSVNKSQEEEPLIVFTKTEKTSLLANFRKGDIAVLYPWQDSANSVLHNQIFKCTIIEITVREVVVRLRSRQFNDALFQEFEYWNLEHDLLDGSFISMYRGLFAFGAAAIRKRMLLLGQTEPQQVPALDYDWPASLTQEQKAILNKALTAPEYFLLWGPPGTGKTSRMLRYMVQYLLEETDENILLLAYTNRAVDEICAAIESIGPHIRDTYLRIGSRYSTAPEYQDQLLRVQSSKLRTRQELKTLIDSRRIIVATVASMSSRGELFELKRFQRVIIDEASQILEPLLVGLLPYFERFILVGDHKQLPAVVMQSPAESAVQDEQLHGIGLHNMRNSLFERLFKQCIYNQWEWAYAQLSHQGRMHEALMAFPNDYFYQNTLRILPPEIGAGIQESELRYSELMATDDINIALYRQRMLFFPTPVDDTGALHKTNAYEAELITLLVRRLLKRMTLSGEELHAHSIGIITPYRAQIALIRQSLEKAALPLDQISVDTVERYQGGTRDIILISMCINAYHQMEALVSLSEEGVDRKLNVALTRAREQIVILGNQKLLETAPLYKNLIASCTTGGSRKRFFIKKEEGDRTWAIGHELV